MFIMHYSSFIGIDFNEVRDTILLVQTNSFACVFSGNQNELLPKVCYLSRDSLPSKDWLAMGTYTCIYSVMRIIVSCFIFRVSFELTEKQVDCQDCYVLDVAVYR